MPSKSKKTASKPKIEWPADIDPNEGWPADAAALGLTPEQLEEACVRLGKPKKHPAEIAGEKVRQRPAPEFRTPDGQIRTMVTSS